MVINLKDSLAARDRLYGSIHRTPLVRSATLSTLCGNEVFLKCENLQKTGSFKIRGALNAVTLLTQEQKARGVVTGSSGNHGQALAFAAGLLGVRSVVVMPQDVSPAKKAACEAYGGETLLCGVTAEERLARAKELAETEGLTMVPPFDDLNIIAGQGTISLEVLEDLPEVDYILAPVGGGGLLSGIAMAMKESNPRTRVVGVEPAVSARLQNSWNKGQNAELAQHEWQPSVADGLRSRRPGTLPFEVTRRYVDDLVTVSEQEIVAALRLILERTKMVVEPSGAVSVAAVLAGRLTVESKKVTCVLSGGNVELGQLARLLVD